MFGLMGVARNGGQPGGAAEFAPADLFSNGELGDHWDAFDTANLFQLSGGTTAVTASGDPVGWMRGQINANQLIQATGIQRPVYRPGYLEFSKASSSSMAVASSTGLFNFLHDGTGSTILIACRCGVVSDPNAIFGLIGTTSISGALVGALLSYDDRSGSSRNNAAYGYMANGSGTNAINSITNDTIPSQTDVVLAYTVASAATPNFNILVDGTNVSNGNIVGTPSVANSTNNLTIGALGGGATSFLSGRIYAALVINRVLTAQEIADWSAYVASN